MAWVLDLVQDGYTPMVELTVDGREVAAGFYGRLISLKIRDEAGQKADTLTCELDDADNAIALPPPKALIRVSLGWREAGGPEPIGTYELQSIGLAGDADSGEKIILQASAADLKRKLKGRGREQFENSTIGALVERVAGRNGMQPRVDPALAGIAIPYRARVDQSEIDFLTTLADEFDAVVKPMGTQLVFARRGEAKSVGGKALPPILIEKRDCTGWRIDPEGRTRYGRVRGSYIDQQTGRREEVEAPTGLEGPDFTLRSPLPSREQASKAAEAEARRLTRDTGSGVFKLARGRASAQAEADVIAGLSFRDGIAGPWRCDAVEQNVDTARGWLTDIEVKAREDGSSTKET